jgi:CheY-like chemotaxis protein
MLAHELRNPLAPIRSGLDLLSLRDGDDDESVCLMRGQVDHLARLVDDLLDVSRIMRGKIQLRREPVDLTAISQSALETVRPSVEEQRQTVTVSTPPDPVWINADPVRVAQIASNLLNNATKYTEPGGTIWLTISRKGGEAVLSVRDNGVGLDSGLLPRVFDLFAQGDRSLERSQGGLGIGLTLVKTLVELHGGKVSAHSEGAGKGSEFIVRFPLLKQVEPPRRLPERPSQVRGRRILVVDDNVGTTKIQSLLLARLGDHEIRTAHDGVSALSIAAEFSPEIVLLDIGLPKMCGYEVARQLRAQPDGEDALLVALTGYGTEEDRRRSLESGFDEHLVKPAGLEALRKLLNHPKLDQLSPGKVAIGTK